MSPETDAVSSDRYPESDTPIKTDTDGAMPDCVRYDLKLTRPHAKAVAGAVIEATGNSLTTRATVHTDYTLTLRVSGDGFAIPAWKTTVDATITCQITDRTLTVFPGSPLTPATSHRSTPLDDND